MILRKEVIQPQVPLRLPCYDFTPVADPTVVGCLPCGLAHRLKVNRGFQGLQCPRSRHQDLLSGFERPSLQACSLNLFCWYVERSGAEPGL